MFVHIEKVQLHLKGGIGKRSQQVSFCDHFLRHQIQQCNSERSDILVNGPAFLHNENILILKFLDGRQIGWYIYRHAARYLCGFENQLKFTSLSGIGQYIDMPGMQAHHML